MDDTAGVEHNTVMEDNAELKESTVAAGRDSTAAVGWENNDGL